MDGTSPRALFRGDDSPCVTFPDSDDDADYQRLDVCRRELEQWKARALEAEARLAAVAAVFGHTSSTDTAPSTPTPVSSKDYLPAVRPSEDKGSAERPRDERKHAKPGPLSRSKRPAATPLPTPSSSTTTARSASTASEPCSAPTASHKEPAPANANAATTLSTLTIPAPTTVTSSAASSTSAQATSALATSRRSTRLNGRKVKVEDFSDDDEDSAIVRRKRPRLVMECVLVPETGKSRESTARSSTPSTSASRKKNVKVESPRKARVAGTPSAAAASGEASRGTAHTSASVSTSRSPPTSAPRQPMNSGPSHVPDAKALNAHPKSATLLSGPDRKPEKLKLRVPARSKSVLMGPAVETHATRAADPRSVLQTNTAEGSRSNVVPKTMPETKEAVETQSAPAQPARAKSMFPDISAVKPTPSALASQQRHMRTPSASKSTTQPGTSRATDGDKSATQPQPPVASTSKLDAPTQALNVHVPLPNLLLASPSHIIPGSYANVPSVSRRFLLHLYGCNENSLLAFLHPKPYTNSRLHTQSSKSNYGPTYTTHPSRLPVAFANLNMNPLLPDRPGRPGILLTRREDVLFTVPTALFVCRGVNEWQYVGDYVSKWVRPVTKEEFCAMGYEVQRTWARSICSKKKPQCWGDMRAIVFGGNAQPRKDRFAEDEMLLALKAGRTHLDVLLFECKRYMHDIAQDIMNWWDRREELHALYTQASGGQTRAVKSSKSAAKAKAASHVVTDNPDDRPSPPCEPCKPRTPSKRARKHISMAGFDADDEDEDEDYRPDD